MTTTRMNAKSSPRYPRGQGCDPAKVRANQRATDAKRPRPVGARFSAAELQALDAERNLDTGESRDQAICRIVPQKLFGPHE